MFEKEFLTAGLTIIGGITIFSITALFKEAVIKPVIKLKSEIGVTAFVIVFYSDRYANPNRSNEQRERQLEAADKLRKVASDLYSALTAVDQWWYGVIRYLFSLPPISSIDKATNNLIFYQIQLLQENP